MCRGFFPQTATGKIKISELICSHAKLSGIYIKETVNYIQRLKGR